MRLCRNLLLLWLAAAPARASGVRPSEAARAGARPATARAGELRPPEAADATRRCGCPASLAKDAEARAAGAGPLVTLECSNLALTRVADRTRRRRARYR